MFVSVTISLTYVTIHGYVLVYQAISLNIAVNFHVVERFKLTLLLSITGLRNLQSWSSSLSNTSINFWSPRSTLSIVINILCGRW
ncbi:ASN_HP2_G0015450.mRNA.1.CDS.1 [Saccharomyces cerevisiae]|nr:ASN_HP2_G0015450.mRNA.1.CDS.1 [Saccharomyces cerevisiae]CAI6556116.1 ASN_HP2_G0015450.mRNA.1.CDS.1 [Saccharomyces cerevisiae]